MVLVLVVSLHSLQSLIAGSFIHLEQGYHLLINLQTFSVGTWRSVAVQNVHITDLVLLVILRHLNYVSVAHILLLGLSYGNFISAQVRWNNELVHVFVDFVRRDLSEVLLRVLLGERSGKVIELDAILLLLLFLAFIVNDLVTRWDHCEWLLRRW